jgi:hypothetical protein
MPDAGRVYGSFDAILGQFGAMFAGADPTGFGCRIRQIRLKTRALRT